MLHCTKNTSPISVLISTVVFFIGSSVFQAATAQNTPENGNSTHNARPKIYKATIDYSNPSRSGTAKIWVKGENKLKIDIEEKDSDGQESHQILIRNENGDYVYQPEKGTAMKIPDMLPHDPFQAYVPYLDYFERYRTPHTSDEEMLASFKAACNSSASCKNVRITGHETLLGEECTIFESTSVQGTTTQSWIVSDKGHPLKVVTTDTDGTTTSMEYKNVEINPEIPNSEFNIPSTADVQGLSGLQDMF